MLVDVPAERYRGGETTPKGANATNLRIKEYMTEYFLFPAVI